ncbi:ligand-dependent corepressor isoform X3 [Oryzias latipes]|uniref:ligand-dependent corepressor isoform X3 n=1 Tax=Oryzias latipes TaxID=8090 RepID=UPI0009D98240|nr:ligand-dependent corepressor isoform X3 [Oryzias latipes]
MASLCETQQGTIDRRGFRQELDSWRHKLIHCVGFQNILDGLIGPELVEDLKLFKDFKHVALDWSFHENCLFCCLRRSKVKEHLLGVNKSRLKGNAKPLLVKDQIAIGKLEKQTEDFLNAVFCRKDIPSFSDPRIPIVAAEILQTMISQFAGEYTSKTSCPQNSHPDPMPHTDQSLPGQALLSGAPPPTSPAALATETAPNQNPVLSKLLMADQDAPLDLTIKKNPAESSEQDGVLDLSIKKKHYSSSRPVHSPCLSPALSVLKRGSLRADGQVGLVMRDLKDGSRMLNFGHSSCSKPTSPLSYSVHIKEEPDVESDPELALSRNTSTEDSKARLGFLKLIQVRNGTEGTEHLNDIPRLLETGGLLTKSPSIQHVPKEPCKGQELSLSQTSCYHLKIPQVRVFASGLDFMSHKYSGSLCQRDFGQKLCSVLPQQIQTQHSGTSNGSGLEKNVCPLPVELQNHGSSHSEYDMGNKQPRKKRGRYRQYNLELLEEAIAEVMGGKMSVSKAQSVYGIPHSTLEYKVKERLGTLKHPPKKKTKLISLVEKQGVSQPTEEGMLPYCVQD